jgi:protein deglycase
MSAPARTVLVPVAHGSEEIETVTIVDVLRRAGAEVTLASVEDTLELVCSRGVRLLADAFIADCAGRAYDLIALPGGAKGAERLRDCAALIAMLRAQRARAAPYAAICAAPAVVLAAHDLLPTRATAHPAFFDALGGAADPARVVQDGTVITSRAPGTALEFALALVAQLYGADRAAAVAAPMLPA